MSRPLVLAGGVILGGHVLLEEALFTELGRLAPTLSDDALVVRLATVARYHGDRGVALRGCLPRSASIPVADLLIPTEAITAATSWLQECCAGATGTDGHLLTQQLFGLLTALVHRYQAHLEVLIASSDAPTIRVLAQVLAQTEAERDLFAGAEIPVELLAAPWATELSDLGQDR